MVKLERNRSIFLAVLSEGRFLADLAREHSLSKEYVREIFHSECRRVNPELYRSLSPSPNPAWRGGMHPPLLRVIRRRAAEFLEGCHA